MRSSPKVTALTTVSLSVLLFTSIVGPVGMAESSAGAARASASEGPGTGVLPRGEDWLGEVNLYREASNVPQVSSNSQWDAGILDHLRYLEKTPSSYITGAYASEHTENPASPYYTSSGAHEGDSSDLYECPATQCTPVQDIDVWLSAPFHALGILRATLGQVAFGANSWGAGLDVISGLGQNPPATTPILFPGPGMTTDLNQFVAEDPTPLETCGSGYKAPAGLPLIALLAQPPGAQLTASLNEPDGATLSSQSRSLCVVDSTTFESNDPIYGPTGAELLANDNAVFLIAKSVLKDGTYTATIDQPGLSPFSWSFTILAPPRFASNGLPKARTGTTYRAQVKVTGGKAPDRVAVASGALPRGLKMSSTGAVTGRPTKLGPFEFTLKVTDARGLSSETYSDIYVK